MVSHTDYFSVIDYLLILRRSLVGWNISQSYSSVSRLRILDILNATTSTILVTRLATLLVC